MDTQKKQVRYTVEFRGRAVRLVEEQRKQARFARLKAGTMIGNRVLRAVMWVLSLY